MFDLKDYVNRLEYIQSREMMTFADLCRELGMARNTLERVMNPDNTLPSKLSTLKKIRDFVDAHEKTWKSL